MVCPLFLKEKRKKKRGELVSLEVKHQMLSFIQTAIWMFSKDRASYYAERNSKLTFINYSAIICTSVKIPLSSFLTRHLPASLQRHRVPVLSDARRNPLAKLNSCPDSRSLCMGYNFYFIFLQNEACKMEDCQFGSLASRDYLPSVKICKRGRSRLSLN